MKERKNELIRFYQNAVSIKLIEIRKINENDKIKSHNTKKISIKQFLDYTKKNIKFYLTSKFQIIIIQVQKKSILSNSNYKNNHTNQPHSIQAVIKQFKPHIKIMSSSKKQINFLISQEQSSFQDTSPNPIETIITNIKKHSQQNGNLLNKYNEQFYLTYFDRNKIQHTVFKLGHEDNLKKQLELEEFMRLFLSFIEHTETQTLFLAMSLRNLFIKIKETTNNQIGVRFTDFTNYLCDKIATDNTDLIVPLKQVPVQKIIPDVNRVRQIDINPPIVMMNKQSDQPRIAKDKKKIDKKLKQRKPVSKFVYNSSNNQIITMGRLSSTIHFYDMELRKLPLDIIPKTFKDISRQIAILSMDFDQCHQRVGAIINGMGISFWELGDNLSTQKSIAKSLGDKIYYLKLFKQWITTDKNTIYFWDIKEETISGKIHYEESHIINAVCEVNHLRCLCISYTTEDEKKPIIFYKDHKPIARYEMGSQGCHTLYYNVASQLIIAAGYHNQLEVLELENNTYSINLIKQLKGHRSIITCVTDIQSTNFVLSGDDLGEVRIWELNTMKCIQVVQVAKSITQLYCTGEKLIFSDSRLNVMEMDKFSSISNNDQEIIQDFFNEENDKHLIITRKSIRILNFYNGRVQKIFVVCDQQEDISSAIGLSFGVIVGTSKGIMKFFTMEGHLKWQVPAHQAEITQLNYDRKTRFIFSLGNDNKLIIWPEKTILEDGPKKIITFKNKNFNLLTLFNEARLLFLGSTQENQVCVWDFQNLKLLTIINLSSPCLFLDINQTYKILIISTVNDQFYFFKLIWKNGHLSYQLIYNGDSHFSSVKNMRKDNKEGHKNQNYLGKIELQVIRKVRKPTIIGQFMQKASDNFDDLKVCIKKDQKEIRNKKKTPSKVSVKTIQFEDNSDNQKDTPSIRVLKQERHQSITEDRQQTLGTLKTLKRIENQITTRIEIKETQNSCYLVIGNSKGQISCYNISVLIKQQFQNHDLPLKKSDSPHLYRPARQEYEIQESKKKYQLLTSENMEKIGKLKKTYFKLLWKQSCINRQPISSISFIQMKNIYLSISLTDGHCKYFDLENGNLKGNMKVNLPLPILWEINVEKDSYIKKNLYETLIILDNILSNHGFQMLSKQYKSINVTSFLQNLKRKRGLKSATSIKRMDFKQPQNLRIEKAVTLLHEEYSIEDLKKSPQKGKISTFDGQSSLKSLQVYKRVKQIKEQMIQDVKQKQLNEKKNIDGIERVSGEVLRQKQEIIKLLKPNYFSVIGEFGTSSNMSKSLQLGSLQERSHLLLQRVKENKKKFNSQHMEMKQSRLKEKKQPVTLPTITQPRHQSLDTKQSESMKQCKMGDGIKEEGSLVSKLVNSLSSSSLDKQKGFEQSNSFSGSFMASFLKTPTSVSVYHSKSPSGSPKSSQLQKMSSLKLNEGKQNELKQREMMSKLQDQTTREILSQINQKLQKYKKSSYNRRQQI